MTTSREKVQIVLGVAGLSCFGMGFAFFNFGSDKEERPSRIHRVGFWKDAGMTKDSERELAVGILVGGAASLVTSFIIRKR